MSSTATSDSSSWGRSLAVLAVALAGFDLARAYVGPGLRPAQMLLGVLTLVVVWLHLRSRGRPMAEAVSCVALAALLLPTYLDRSRSMESDGVYYYSFLRSWLFDLDVDHRNDLALLGARPDIPNVLPVGAAILWSPFVLCIHLLRQAARLFGAGPPTGVEPLYQGAACLGTLVYGAAGLFVLRGLLARWMLPSVAFWTTVLCWIGSPLRFYLVTLPGLAHAGEFFASTLVLSTYLALRERCDLRRAAYAGAACGLVFLTRSQDALLLVLPASELALGLARGPDRRVYARALLALVAAFGLVALPQVLVWQAMFGTPILIPHKVIHGDEFMHAVHPQFAGTLFSPRGGLFTLYPAMLLAVVGLATLPFRRSPGAAAPQPDGRYLLGLLPAAVGMWILNSTIFDWYQVRRFTGLVPLLAPGLAVVLSPLARAGLLPMALAAFLFYRYDLAVDSLRAQPGQPAPVRSTLLELGDSLASDVYRLLEPGAPRAAVALLAVYTGESVLDENVTFLDLDRDLRVLRLPQRARHLSEVAVEDGLACRWVRDRETRLFLPIAWQGGIVVTLRARALETDHAQMMDLQWNETSVGQLEMKPAWDDYRFRVPPELVRLGTNVLVVRFERTPIYHRVRGKGPREVRPAALARISLHRALD